jgi:alpha-glucoside transport system substrate-binding protein
MRSPVLRRTTLLGTALFTVAGLTLTACGGGGSGSSNSTTVTIWSSIDPAVKAGMQKKLEAELKAQGSKITINWQSVQNINQLIITKMQAGSVPDIAFVPQPGVVKQMTQVGTVYPMNNVVDMASLQKSMLPGSTNFSMINGQLDGLLVSMNVKGLVFYDKPAWKQAGYKIPKTLSDLEALTNQIKASGTAPWCFGIESGAATGWPATDWLESLLLKYSGTTVYNDWVAGKVKFASSQVTQAANEFDKLLLTSGNTYGGRSAIASTNFQTTGNPLVQSPPKCYMYGQGSFATGFFPASVIKDIDKNIGVFGLPPATAGGSNPVEVGGDSITMLNNSTNTQTVVKLLAGTDIGDDAGPSSSFISPHTDFKLSLYPNNITRKMASIAYHASSTAYDASDQMPAAVGSGTFWKEMTAWISGQEDLPTALKNIDASWPAS